MANTLSIMTYNVHRCTGLDRKTSTERIAEVIAGCDCDIVALQEVDSGRVRPAVSDQVADIVACLARLSGKECELHMERERCGNVILSRFPLHLVKAGGLQTPGIRRGHARRGALWTEIEAFGRKIQFINTHLGLTPRQRFMQAKVLAGPDWLKNLGCIPPVILCGDFNAQPGSAVHRVLMEVLEGPKTHRDDGKLEKTWPSLYPFMRIDHLFVSADITVTEAAVPRSELTRLASDHLPLIVRLNIP